ncbi:hypothetical protein [Pseudomonas citri]|uniref:hypothetical protein n=1 Tax=Pseudomonas citri TaxID=2978349 RepID=UPI0021B5DF7E|nr:hypothetical protein [Pseudomonas citri]
MTSSSASSEESFISAILAEDELGIVIRSHIYIESALDSFIDEFIHDFSYIKKMQLDFSQRVNLAVAVGFPKEYASALMHLGEMRNKFAHRLDTKIDKSSMKNFYKTFSSEQKNLIHLTFKNTIEKVSIGHKKTLLDLSPKEQFAILSTALRMQILALMPSKDQ